MTDSTAGTGTGGAIAPPDPWDPLVRVTHWAIAAAVLANGLFVKPGGTVHVWIGWTVLALLALRLAWGFVGPEEARFTAFPPAPRAALAHLRSLFRGRPKEHRSHNPLGALMVYAFWAALAGVTLTGLVMTDARSPVTIAEEKAAVAAGDWSVLANAGDGEKNEAMKDAAKEVHEIMANLLLILAALHVAGVAIESRALKRNLVRPMLTGPQKR
ncbi:cytochrome b/b6 domain-containing protein [Pelagovum pacificum]|uniref:Cytochrome B n=1 Tax=Pelagovum pacificum TaxID=2588711 RepID=A0A5C5GFC3_9RHOB|nr:cytochrome b/b6 domain-containing protein [Pelagovum pacificum]QQA43625.1 cytochrome b/b6 domain-containing protein [Pelagovum pacificum]TNY33240.1 cytochrome B [Pelagovum pacificum]